MNPIETIDQLEEQLSRPSEALYETLQKKAPGDLLILGAGGKMGGALARMANRAVSKLGDSRRVIAVSRFSNPALRPQFEANGVETIAGDLLQHEFVEKLPDAQNVIYLVGTKFGSDQRQAFTWATNAFLPGLIANRFPQSRIVALSTGNVYGPVSCRDQGGSEEDDPLQPVGEYAMSCVGRERVLQHFCHVNGTPMSLIRLNYAVELRYGVLVDLAQLVVSGKPASLAVGYANVIWQRDACDWILRSLALCRSPPTTLNVTGPELVSCREVCARFGEAFGCPVQFAEMEGPTALLSNASRAIEHFGPPGVSLDELIELTAHWIKGGGATWNKPTRFERSDGVF